jgi:hypothetical protein
LGLAGLYVESNTAKTTLKTRALKDNIMEQQTTYTWEQVCNTLEWYGCAPPAWYDSKHTDLSAAAQWILHILTHEHADAPGGVSMGSNISMLPLTDQLTDLRDLARYSLLIHDNPNNLWVWFALCLSLVPQAHWVGSLFKGALKVQFGRAPYTLWLLRFKYKPVEFKPSWLARKFPAWFDAAPTPSPRAIASEAFEELWTLTQDDLERGHRALKHAHLRHPDVIKTLDILHIDHPWAYMEEQITVLKHALTPAVLNGVLSRVTDVLQALLRTIQPHSPPHTQKAINNIFARLALVQQQAHAHWPTLLALMTPYLERIACNWASEAQEAAKVSSPNAKTEPKPTRKPKPEAPCEPLEALLKAVQTKFQ